MIRLPSSSGTGFLVQRAGKLCVVTNAHVIGTLEQANSAMAVFFFDWQNARDVVEIALDPSAYFFTSPEPPDDAEIDSTHLDVSIIALNVTLPATMPLASQKKFKPGPSSR